MLPASRPVWDAHMETEPPATDGRRRVFRGMATNRRRVLAEMFGACARALFQSWRLHLVPAPRPGTNEFRPGLVDW